MFATTAHSLRRGYQQAIAARVTEKAVDALAAVEVDADECKWQASPHRHIGFLQHQLPVRQKRQCFLRGTFVQLLLKTMPLRHILQMCRKARSAAPPQNATRGR